MIPWRSLSILALCALCFVCAPSRETQAFVDSQVLARYVTDSTPRSAIQSPSSRDSRPEAADARDNRNILTRSFFASLLLGDPFSGLGVLDFLIVGLAIFLVYRVTRGPGESEKKPDLQPGQESQPGERRFGPGPESEAYKRAAQSWDMLRAKPNSEQDSSPAPALESRPSPPQSPRAADAPPPLSSPSQKAQETEDEFLRGAKIVYCRIYESLAAADLNDVKHFTSAMMFEELKPLSGRRLGQILLVEANTLDRKTTAGIAQARVAFEALVQKEGAAQPEQSREVWRFCREASDPASTWRLAAIER